MASDIGPYRRREGRKLLYFVVFLEPVKGEEVFQPEGDIGTFSDLDCSLVLTFLRSEDP
jgi:hypothetical protein